MVSGREDYVGAISVSLLYDEDIFFLGSGDCVVALSVLLLDGEDNVVTVDEALTICLGDDDFVVAVDEAAVLLLGDEDCVVAVDDAAVVCFDDNE